MAGAQTSVGLNLFILAMVCFFHMSLTRKFKPSVPESAAMTLAGSGLIALGFKKVLINFAKL